MNPLSEHAQLSQRCLPDAHCLKSTRETPLSARLPARWCEAPSSPARAPQVRIPPPLVSPPPAPQSQQSPFCRLLPTPWAILGPQGSASLVGDSCLLPAVGVEKQALRLSLGGGGGAAEGTLWRQCPQDGIVPAQAVAVVVVMDDGHLHGHPVQVHHTVHHWGRQWGSHAWVGGKEGGTTSKRGRTRRSGVPAPKSQGRWPALGVPSPWSMPLMKKCRAELDFLVRPMWSPS